MDRLQLMVFGKFLERGTDWFPLAGNKFMLARTARLGEAYSVFDARSGTAFDGTLARADGTGSFGSPAPAGTELRVVRDYGGDLALAKAERSRTIDARTDELIAEGFEYPASSGVYHSLSLQAQNKRNAAFAARAEPEFSYPVEWDNIDNTSTVALADAAALRTFYVAAVNALEAILVSGTALKKQVTAAADIAAVEAVIDPR